MSSKPGMDIPGPHGLKAVLAWRGFAVAPLRTLIKLADQHGHFFQLRIGRSQWW